MSEIIHIGGIQADVEKLREVAQACGLALVVLHGSRAEGRARPDSDADIAIWAFRRPFENGNWVWKVFEGLEEAIECPGRLDIAFLNSQSPILLYEVATRGKVLYEAEPGTFTRFCAYAAQLYDDHRPLFEEHQRYLRKPAARSLKPEATDMAARSPKPEAMDEVHARLIRQKLVYLAERLEKLESFMVPAFEEYKGEPWRPAAVERAAQVVIDTVIGTNHILLRACDKPPAASSWDSFRKVQELGIIGPELAERFIKSYVGLRNRLVHLYEPLDDRLVFETVQGLVEDARRYLEEVAGFVEVESGK